MKKFIIYAPPYDENSGGSIALHKLCHLLNELGREAFIYPHLPSFELNVSTANNIEKYAAQLVNQIKVSRDIKTNPNFKTPIIPPNLGDFASDDMVVIYPEITEGNPLKAKNVVRWLLHIPGFHTKKINFGNNELYFLYGEKFRGGFSHPYSQISNSMLDIPHIPTDLYKNVHKTNRHGIAYCLRKNKNPIFIHDNEDSICIDGKSHLEISDIFNQSKTFISYDPYTFYSKLAAISGCQSIVAPQNDKKISDLYPDLNVMNGIAYGFEDIERSIKTRPLLLSRILNIERDNNFKVLKFINEVDLFFQ